MEKEFASAFVLSPQVGTVLFLIAALAVLRLISRLLDQVPARPRRANIRELAQGSASAVRRLLQNARYG